MVVQEVPGQAGVRFEDLAQTLVTNEDPTAQHAPVPGESVGVSSAEALGRLKAVFQHLPGATEALQDLQAADTAVADIAALVQSVVDRLRAVPVIQQIIGDQRDRLAAAVGDALKDGMRLVGSGALNTSVLADRGNGRYGLLRPLGKGAFGYVAGVDLAEPVQPSGEQDPYGKPEHAVKILIDADMQQGDKHFRRFWAERTMLAAVHSGAPQVYADGVTAEGRPYFVMRYIPGMDFAAVLDAVNYSIEHDETNQLRWPSQWMYLALASMSKTMHGIHHPEGAEEVVANDERLQELDRDTANWKERPVGLVHRDLKPSNIRLDTEGRVWIMDFGLVYTSDEDQTRLTQTGQVMGTPAYMAPELIRDSKRNTTTKCDVYALGCMAFELLTGTPPFAHKEGVMQVLSAHQNEYPNFDLIQSPEARAVVQRMMHKDPAQRPDLDTAASAFHALFLGGVSEEERRQYAGFLSLPHVARKLPVPEGFMELSHLTGSDSTASGGEHSLCFTQSLAMHGGDLPPDVDDNMPEVYVVGRKGKPLKLTNFVKFRRWVGRHQLVVTGTVAALLAAVLIPLGVHYSGRKPGAAENGALVERLPTSSVRLDIDNGGRVTGIAIFDESPVQISAEGIDTVKAGGTTAGALFRVESDQLLTALGGEDPLLLPERMRKGGSTVGMLLLGAPGEAGAASAGKVVYFGGEEKAFFVDDGSGRIRLYTNNTTLLRARSGECAGWGGLEKAYEDQTFCAVVGAFPEVDSEEGELLNSQGKPSNSVTTVNGQVRVFREQVSKRQTQVTLSTE